MADELEQIKRKAEQAKAYTQAIFKGIPAKDAQRLAEAIALVGTNVNKLSEEELKNLNKSLGDLAEEGLKVANEQTDATIKGFEILYNTESETNNKLRKGYIARKLFTLKTAKAERKIVEAEEKGMLAMAKARWEKMGLQFAQTTRKYIGKEPSGKMFGTLMKAGGIVGSIAALIKILSKSLAPLAHRTKEAIPALQQSGIAMGKTSAHMEVLSREATSLLYGFESLGRAWITRSQAMALYNTTLKEQINSLGFSAQIHERYTEVTEEARLAAVDHSQKLTLQLAKLSTGLTGSTDSVKKLASIAVKWNINSQRGVNILGAGISKLSGMARVSAPLIMQTFENMGQAMLGTGKEIGEMASYITPVIKRIREFGDTAQMTDKEVSEMIKGVNNLAKSSKTFTYMALRGPSGKGFAQDYISAIETSPLARNIHNLSRISELTKGNRAYAQIMMEQMGITEGMGQAMQMKFVDAITKGDIKPERFKGTQEEQMQQLLGVFEEQGIEIGEMGRGVLMGTNLEEQMVDYLRRILDTAVDAVYLISKKWGGLLGTEDLTAEIARTREKLNKANAENVPRSTYVSPGSGLG